MNFTSEQLAYASGSLLDEFAKDAKLIRRTDESDIEFRCRVFAEVFNTITLDREDFDALACAVEELEKYQHTPHPEGCDGARDYLVKIMNAKHVLAKARGELK